MAGFSIFGHVQWGETNSSPPAPTPVEPGTARETDGYVIDVVTPAGAMVARLPYWSGGKWTREVSAPSILTFTYPYADLPSTCVFPNLLYLWYDGILKDIFLINKRTKKLGDAAPEWAIEGRGLLAQLAMDESHTLSTSTTIEAILASLFADQANGVFSDIQIGTIDPAIVAQTRFIKTKDQSILDACKTLVSTVGGWFEVGSDAKFHWHEYAAETTAEIRAGANVIDLEVSEDYSAIRTSVKLLGAGASGDNITATASGDNAGTYGAAQGVVVDTRLGNSATVTARAAIDAIDYSYPKRTYKIGAIDLSRIPGTTDWAHMALDLGQRINVVASDIGEAIATHVLRITRSLDNPAEVEINVGDETAADAQAGTGARSYHATRRLDAADLLARVIERAEETKRDTGLYDAIARQIGGSLSDLDRVLWGNSGAAGAISDAWADLLDNENFLDWLDDAVAELVAAGSENFPTAGINIQSVGTSNQGGASAHFSREDHVHRGADLGSATPQPIAQTGSAGVGTAASRQDHVHAGVQLATGAPQDVTSGANAVGSATEAAKSDHKHHGMPHVVDAYATLATTMSGEAVGTIGFASDVKQPFVKSASGEFRQLVTYIGDVVSLPALPTDEWIVFLKYEGVIWIGINGETEWIPISRGTLESGTP